MLLDVPVKKLIPTRFISAWKAVLSAEGEETLPLPPGYCLKDVHSKLDLDEKELSGALGPTWMIVATGTPYSAPCKQNHIFSWHYHPDGDSRFSVEDWIAFIISDAQITLLFTANHFCLYTKVHNGKWKDISSALTGTRNMSKNGT